MSAFQSPMVPARSPESAAVIPSISASQAEAPLRGAAVSVFGVVFAALIVSYLWPVAASPSSSGTGRSSASTLVAHVSGLSQVEVDRADWRAQICSGANAVGVGLRGEYFARTGWKGEPLLVRTDATLEFDSRLDWPDTASAAPRSVRWSGWLRAPLTGRYRFHGDPQGVVIEISGRAVAGPKVLDDAPVELAAGRFYPITVALERIDPAAGALRLQWTAPHGARFTIPRNALFLPTESVKAVGTAAASPR